EVERRISLQLGLAHCEWKKAKVNLIDAPGYANFVAEAISALRVADAALVVVDAVSGVEVQTEKTWNIAQDQGLPRIVAINRIDRERASFERTIESLQSVFGRSVVPLAVPIGEEKGFQGIVDLVTEQATTWPDDGSGKAKSGHVPDLVADSVKSWREKLVEM